MGCKSRAFKARKQKKVGGHQSAAAGSPK